MPKFNTLLRECGIDPDVVQLVRHKDRGPSDTTPYSLYLTNPAKFEEYQSYQGRKVFHRPLIASFVVSPAPIYETVFVGLYGVAPPKLNTETVVCPVREKAFTSGRALIYPLTLKQELQELILRLTIVWGEGYRSWVQRADKQNKDIQEIRQQFIEPARIRK
jgi:hypothetical protein